MSEDKSLKKTIFAINTSEYWDDRFRSGDWREHLGNYQTQFFGEILLSLLPDWLCKDIAEQSMSLCDWGCAEGQTAHLMKKRFPASVVTGVDISAHAVLKAKELFPECDFNHEDWLETSEIKSKYDVIIASNVLEHFDDPIRVLRDVLFQRATNYVVLLVPYNEPAESMHEEHVFRFVAESVPSNFIVEGWHCVLFRVKNTQKCLNTQWQGYQALVVYCCGRHLMELKHWSPNMSDLEGEKREIQDDLHDLYAVCESLQGQYRELQAQHRELQAQHRELQAQHRELMTQNTGLQAQHIELLMQHTEIQTQYAELEVQYGSTRELLHSYQSRLDTWRSQIAVSIADKLYYYYRKLLSKFNGLDKLIRIFTGRNSFNIDFFKKNKISLPVSSKIELSKKSFSVSSEEIPLVSIALPVYNQCNFLRDSIETVLSQKYQRIELIILNDGSTDGVEAVLNEYAHHPKVLILTQDNQKLPKALTNAFLFASGDYLTWTSADNLMHPDQVEKLVSFLGANPDVAMVYSDYYAIDDRGQGLEDPQFRPHNRREPHSPEIHLPRDPSPINRIADNFIGASFMYRRSVGDIIGEYDPQLGVEDYDYWMRINGLFKISHLGTEDLLYYYRVHDNTLNARARELKIFEAVDRLMAYEQKRSEYYSERFTLYCDAETRKLFGMEKEGAKDYWDLADKNEKNLLVLNAGSLYHLTYMDTSVYSCVAVWFTDDTRNKAYKYQYHLQKKVDVCFACESQSLTDRLRIVHASVVACRPSELQSFSENFANNFSYYGGTRTHDERYLVPPRVYTGTDRPLRLMLQVDVYSHGGVEQVIIDQAQVLKNMGMEVWFCICQQSNRKPQFLTDDVRCLYVDDSRPEESYRALLQDHQIDLVNAHYSLFGAQICHEMGIPFIQTVHNTYVWFNKSKIQEYQEADKYTTAYVCVSNNVAWYSNEVLKLSAHKTVVIPNGVQTERFCFKEELRSAARKQYGFSDTDYVVVNVATVYATKGQKFLVEALAQTIKKCPNLKLLLIGNVIEQEYYEDINRKIAMYGIEDNVVWLGYVEDMVTLYHAVDALVLTSFWEGCSIAILEALSMGLPILATKVGAIEEQTDYENAVIIDAPVSDIIDLGFVNMATLLYGNQFKLIRDISLGLEKLYNGYKRKEVSLEYRRRISGEKAYSLYYHLFEYLNVRGSVKGIHKWLRQIYSSN